MTLRLLTAGESHGPQLTVIIDGVPSGLPLAADDINACLRARARGHGRGGRQQIECDAVEFVGGVRHGRTTGGPVAMQIPNRDFANWREVMVAATPVAGTDVAAKPLTCPRPGHADLAGGLKHNLHDMRDVLERASARETAARVAAGSVARRVLAECGIAVRGHVVQIGEVRACVDVPRDVAAAYWHTADSSPVRCGDAGAAAHMIAQIDAARAQKDSIGGVFEVIAFGAPPGLGTYAQWDRRLDGRIAHAVMSIPGVKGVEIGLGFGMAALPGSRVHDAIGYQRAGSVSGLRSPVDGDWSPATGPGFFRSTNHAGGIEGGMSNGEPIVVRAVMKPLATLMHPLPSVDVRTKEAACAHLERSDVCVVSAASCVAEAMLAWVLADALLEKCGGDSLPELLRNYGGYTHQLRAY